ncbi:MAG: pyridoxal-phosphate dependent enzyme, partial [Bacteroidetes bacterium]
VTAVSAGNHAIAVSIVARLLGTHCKVVMPPTSSPAAIERCKKLGAEVVVVGHVSEAFTEIERIQQTEGRTFVHPFEGPLTALGTATLALEYYQQAGRLDAAIIPIGGGGLAAGMSAAFKQLNPHIRLFGVEAEGAPNMYNSFKLGKPAKNAEVHTIAASLAPPYSLPYSFGLCKQFLEKVVLVSDDELCKAMAIAFEDLKMVLEPAGAASMAALLGPLREELKGKRVGIIACGSNIDMDHFARYVQRGMRLQEQQTHASQ